jgi:phosphoribosylformimino-5-aminoimidazole carboxamide ribonucleotide (ProFAR) isomerase
MSTMNDFAIIPAIDLKDGAVVHASGGVRERRRRDAPH